MTCFWCHCRAAQLWLPNNPSDNPLWICGNHSEDFVRVLAESGFRKATPEEFDVSVVHQT